MYLIVTFTLVHFYSVYIDFSEQGTTHQSKSRSRLSFVFHFLVSISWSCDPAAAGMRIRLVKRTCRKNLRKKVVASVTYYTYLKSFVDILLQHII